MDLFQEELRKELIAAKAVGYISKSFRNLRHLNTVLRSYKKFYPELNAQETYGPISDVVETSKDLGDYLYALKYFVASDTLKSSLTTFNNVNLNSMLEESDLKDLTNGNISDFAPIYLNQVKADLEIAHSLLSSSFQAVEIEKASEMVRNIILKIHAV